MNTGPLIPRLCRGLSTLPNATFLGFRGLLSSPPLPYSAHSSLGLGEPFVCGYLGRGALGTSRGGGRSGRGGGQAACQVVMDAGRARASLMLTRARKQMVLQPERNFQGVALPPTPQAPSRWTSWSLLSVQSQSHRNREGNRSGGRKRLEKVVCVLGSPEALQSVLVSLVAPPPLGHPLLCSLPLLGALP